MKDNLVRVFIAALFIAIYSSIAYGAVEFDSVSFDPAIIAAGDEVDATINFHDEAFYDTSSKYKGTTLKVFLEPADIKSLPSISSTTAVFILSKACWLGRSLAMEKLRPVPA